ncbi:MAG: dTMP kinase [Bacteroidia bacterium]|nr:dTMP kinase [Bacteroidia bacterium]
MRKNYFIAFEGIDGSGKSTQVKSLTEKLNQSGYKVYSTFEPTDSPIGSLIKKIFKGQMEADHKTIAALFVADRLDHLLNKTNGLLKKMEEGFTVISDRYYFSSYAYHGTHMPMDWVIEANTLCADLLRPDLTVFIDVPADVCMQRLSTGRNMMELYESLDNLNKVREKYFESFDKLKHEENIFITDGNRSSDAIFNDIWNKIGSILQLHKLHS